MASRMERILNSIKIRAGRDVYESIVNTCGKMDVKAIIDGLENTCGAEVVVEILRPCGSQCITPGSLAYAKAMYAAAADFEDFLRGLNEKFIGGGHLHLKDGKIIGIYEKCYCGLAKKAKGLSPLFCHCSEGWYQRLFEDTLGKSVEVKILQTVFSGADRCEFEITYQA